MQRPAQALCARTLAAGLDQPGPGLLPPSLQARSRVQLCKVELGLTDDAQRRLPCVKSIALTAVTPTSSRMAASKTKTIKEVLLVLPKQVQVCRQSFNSVTHQWLAMALPLGELPNQDTKLTQISCTSCTGTASMCSLALFMFQLRVWLGLTEPD